jgi:putative RecB family exonuclease
LSPSSITTWKQCPLLFRKRYIEKLPEPTSTALARGIASHDALEQLYKLEPSLRNETNLHNLFRQKWSELRKDLKYVPLFENELDKERKWGLESLDILSNYFLIENPVQVQPHITEQRVSIELSSDGGGEGSSDKGSHQKHKVELVGVLDRMDKDEQSGDFIIVDYKTGKAPDISRYPVSTQVKILQEKVF